MSAKNSFIFFLFFFTITLQGQTEVKPNVVIILLDDAGYADFGFMGSKDMVTPNIDKIAGNGVYFTDAHTTGSACSPSRAGILTGRYQQRFGHEQNTIRSSDGMDPKEKTLADVLKTAGYKTAAFGKWHLGYKAEHHPNVRGFDEFKGFISGSRSYWSNANQDQPGKSTATQHNGVFVTFTGYYTDVLGDQAISFIDDNKENPFFIYLAYNAIHTPLEAKSEDLALFSHISNISRRKVVAMNYALDKSVGRVIEKLETEGILDNTLIFFLSDNGGPSGSAYDNGVLKSSKGYEFEGGHRVSFAMQWNGKIPKGTVFNGLSSALDIFPTSMNAAGIDNTIGKPLDGVDLIPYLDNDPSNDDVDPHNKLFWRISPWEAARIGDYKMVRASSAATAVYNLDTDVGEIVDIKKNNTDKFNLLASEMDSWASEMVEQQWPGSSQYQDPKFYAYEDLIKNRPSRISSMSVDQIVAQNKGKNHYYDVISRENWKVIYVDGEVSGNEGNKVIDGDYRTFWDSGTPNGTSSSVHEIQIDLGNKYGIRGLRYSPRNDGYFTGSILDYEIYVSNDVNDWGAAVKVGSWNYGTSDRDALFTAIDARYIRFVSKSSKKGNNAIITELNVIDASETQYDNCDEFENFGRGDLESFIQSDIIPYTTNQDKQNEGSFTISDEGNTVNIVGNRWLKTQKKYTITENTMLSFDYKSDKNGEIHAIGFDEDNTQSSSSVFSIYGTDSNWGISATETYTPEGEYKSFNIPVGKYFTGNNMNLVFVNDNDVSNPENTSSYSNIQIYEKQDREPLIIEGNYKIIDVENNQVLNIEDEKVVLSEVNESSSQKWYFTHRKNSYYTIRNNKTNKYLRVLNDNGTLKIVETDDDKACSSEWGVEEADGGNYKLIHKVNNLILEKNNSNEVTIGEYSNAITKEWILTPSGVALSSSNNEVENNFLILNPIEKGNKPVLISNKRIKNVTVSIYNLQGKKIHSQSYETPSNRTEIDKNLNTSGIYIFKFSLNNDNNYYYQKIVVN